MTRLDHGFLKSILHYEEESGLFTWLVVRKKGCKIGALAGSSRKDGYLQIKINGKLYLAHRLAWFYMTGKWPEKEIDHKNTITSDNAWSNLREADRSRNMWNKSKHAKNSSGLKGVSFHKWTRKWLAQIMVDGKKIYLGCYVDKFQASLAYAEASKLHFGEYSRSS